MRLQPVGPSWLPITMGSVKEEKPRLKTAEVLHLEFSGSFMGRPAGPKAVSLYFCGAQRKLMSYNAERFFRLNPSEDITQLKEKSLKSIEALARVIRDEDPDVLALQEVGDAQLLEAFNQRFLNGKYPNIVSLPTGKHANIKVAFMSKAHVKVTESKSHRREQCTGDEDCGNRDFLEASFETDTGYRFTIYNVHFKSMGLRVNHRRVSDEAGTMPTRMREAATAAAIMKQRFQVDPNARIFVTGDINAKHDTPHGQPVIETLTMVKDHDSGNDLTEVMLKDHNPVPTYYGGSRYGKLKLDYTFVSQALLKDIKQAYVAGKFHRPWKTASDHLPLVTIFEEPDSPTAAAQDKPSAKKRRLRFSGEFLNRIA